MTESQVATHKSEGAGVYCKVVMNSNSKDVILLMILETFNLVSVL